MKKYYLPAIIAILLILTGYYLWSIKQSAGGGAQAPQGGGLPVAVYRVEAKPLSDDLLAVGTLQADEAVTVKSEIPGKIDNIGFAEGQLVQKGDLIVEIDSRMYEQEVERTKAVYDLAQSTYQRNSDLSRVGAASKQSRDEARSSYIESKAAYEKANIDYSKTKIQAPFDGMIGMRAVSNGDYLNIGSVITEIVAINPVKVEFALPEKYFAVLKEGLTLFITVDSWPGRQFEGSIYAINPQIDPATRNIVAKAVIKNDDKLLRPGMFGYVTIHVDVNEKALMIPEESLIPNGEKVMVMKVIDGKVVSGEVKIGTRNKGMVEITSGVAEGDAVITAGHMKVRDGMPVTALPDERQMPAQAAPEGEKKPENTTGK
jgi:membrane fusion protein (multidrug efflux system)